MERREFIKLASATAALAAIPGCATKGGGKSIGRVVVIGGGRRHQPETLADGTRRFATLAGFRGVFEQVPPPVSAKKVAGTSERPRLAIFRSDKHIYAQAIDDASARVSGYLRTYTLLNAGHGIAIGAGLWLIGLPAALLFGLIAARIAPASACRGSVDTSWFHGLSGGKMRQPSMKTPPSGVALKAFCSRLANTRSNSNTAWKTLPCSTWSLRRRSMRRS